MIDVGGGYLDILAVETAGFKMIDVTCASILSTKFRTGRKIFSIFIKKTTTSLPKALITRLLSVAKNRALSVMPSSRVDDTEGWFGVLISNYFWHLMLNLRKYPQLTYFKRKILRGPLISEWWIRIQKMTALFQIFWFSSDSQQHKFDIICRIIFC